MRRAPKSARESRIPGATGENNYTRSSFVSWWSVRGALLMPDVCRANGFSGRCASAAMRPRTRSRSRRTSCTSCRSRSVGALSERFPREIHTTGRRGCVEEMPECRDGCFRIPERPGPRHGAAHGAEGKVSERLRVLREPAPGSVSGISTGYRIFDRGRPRAAPADHAADPEKGGSTLLFTAGGVFEPDKKLAAAPLSTTPGIHVAPGEGLSCQKQKFRKNNMRLARLPPRVSSASRCSPLRPHEPSSSWRSTKASPTTSPPRRSARSTRIGRPARKAPQDDVKVVRSISTRFSGRAWTTSSTTSHSCTRPTIRSYPLRDGKYQLVALTKGYTDYKARFFVKGDAKMKQPAT